MLTLQVAERVSAERAETVGGGNSCGYQIRLQRYASLGGGRLRTLVQTLVSLPLSG